MQIIGHRGSRGLAPENTLASLEKAIEHKANRIEFDLRVTKDGAVILHHNRSLADPSGQKHLISKTTYAVLKEHKPDLTTLDEALQSVGKVPLYIEVKPGVNLTPIVKILRGWSGDFWLGSKSQKTLLELHRALPEVPKVVIHPWSGVIARRRARQVKTNLIAMRQQWLWFGFIKAVSRGDNQLFAYTLNDPAKAKRWEKYGLAGVVTDYPDRFENW